MLLLHTIPYLTDNGIGRQEAAFAMVIASIPAMLSKPFWGTLIDRVAVKPLAALSASVTGFALLLIVFAVKQTPAAHLRGFFGARTRLGRHDPHARGDLGQLFGRTHRCNTGRWAPLRALAPGSWAYVWTCLANTTEPCKLLVC